MPKEFEARYYTTEADGLVHCNLCPNNCAIPLMRFGRCKVRFNQDGVLLAKNYGMVLSGSKDPIEKKPLYHFLPGTFAWSYGSVGCNLFCKFCQNWHISRSDLKELDFAAEYLSPQAAAKEAKDSGCDSVAYTYNEPLIWFEWILDTAAEVRKTGLKNVLVTNGFVNEEPLRELLHVIDAANVDVKGDQDFYKKLCGVSHYETVLRTCEIMHEQNVHLEITNLVVPGKNDSKEQLQILIQFILENLDENVPLHFSRYFPNYKLNIPPTPIRTLVEARELALEAGLNYVYLGNIRDSNASDTFCKKCGELLITRRGYSTKLVGLTSSLTCSNCQTLADIR